MKRKKYRIKNKFRFISSFTVCMLILAFSGNALLGMSSAAGRNAQRYISIRVEEGDTLWGIAKSYGKNVDCRRLIYEIEQLNGISAGSLRAGQYITIPFDVL